MAADRDEIERRFAERERQVAEKKRLEDAFCWALHIAVGPPRYTADDSFQLTVPWLREFMDQSRKQTVTFLKEHGQTIVISADEFIRWVNRGCRFETSEERRKRIGIRLMNARLTGD